MKQKNPIRKLMSLLLAAVMAMGLMAPGIPVAEAASDTYKITSMKVTSWYGDIPSNYYFQATNGTQDLRGICADPESNPGAVGATFSLDKTDSVIVGLAWYADQTSDGDELWAIHHAIAEHIGKNNNVMTSDIRWYLDHAAGNAANAPSNFMAYTTSRPSGGGQIMLVWGRKPTGNINLVKSSANTAISAGSTYSLGGAEYGVYGSRADAANNTNKLRRLTTEADGTSNTATNLDPGTYYLRELIAPPGYALSNEIIAVTIDSGKTTTARVTDYPQSDPVGILLRKVDSRTADGSATRG